MLFDHLCIVRSCFSVHIQARVGLAQWCHFTVTTSWAVTPLPVSWRDSWPTPRSTQKNWGGWEAYDMEFHVSRIVLPSLCAKITINLHSEMTQFQSIYVCKRTWFERLLHKNGVSKDRWSLVTGSPILEYRNICQEYMVFQDRWSLMEVVF